MSRLTRRVLLAPRRAVGGQQAFIVAGSYSFVVPANVTSLCAVCIGRGGAPLEFYIEEEGVWSAAGGAGGGLAYSNGLPVTPGETLTVLIDTARSRIRRGSTTLVEASAAVNQAPGVGVSGQGLRQGGSGGNSYGQNMGSSAAGYTTDGVGGGNLSSAGGDGSALTGGGAAGLAGGRPATSGGDFGGGGGMVGGSGAPGAPGKGGVRIIWGEGRAYPSTNTADV